MSVQGKDVQQKYDFHLFFHVVSIQVGINETFP
jgi:hypothetical protein